MGELYDDNRYNNGYEFIYKENILYINIYNNGSLYNTIELRINLRYDIKYNINNINLSIIFNPIETRNRFHIFINKKKSYS